MFTLEQYTSHPLCDQSIEGIVSDTCTSLLQEYNRTKVNSCSVGETNHSDKRITLICLP